MLTDPGIVVVVENTVDMKRCPKVQNGRIGGVKLPQPTGHGHVRLDLRCLQPIAPIVLINILHPFVFFSHYICVSIYLNEGGKHTEGQIKYENIRIY